MTTIHTRQLTTIYATQLKTRHVQKVNNVVMNTEHECIFLQGIVKECRLSATTACSCHQSELNNYFWRGRCFALSQTDEMRGKVWGLIVSEHFCAFTVSRQTEIW